MTNFVGKVKIAPEDLERADSYLPLLTKEALVQCMAPACVEKVRIILPMGESGGEQAPQTIPIPEIYKESTLNRSLCTAFVLLYFYLKMPDITGQYDPNGEMKLAANDFDRYGGVLTQIERMKSSRDAELRDKVYAILADYKDFEKRLGAEIHSLLEIRNDVCSRLTMMMTMQTDPETLQNALQQSDRLAHEVKAQKAQVQKDAKELYRKGAQKAIIEKRMNEHFKAEVEKYGC